MKKLKVLMLGLSMLFLAGCQKNVEVETVKNESAVKFRVVGDSRTPEEFMSTKEIERVENAFKSMEGRTYKGSVVEISEPMTRGGSSKDKGTFYRITEDDVPVIPIDGSYLFICVEIDLKKEVWTFSTDVTYAIGQNVSYGLGYNSPDDEVNNVHKETYIWEDATTGDYRILMDYACSFIVRLKNTPNYNAAQVAFPLEVQWDQRVNYTNCCDVVINQRSVRVKYLNLPGM